MPTEIEAKIKLEDFSALRVALATVGAVRKGTVQEQNLIFDREDGSLRRSDCGLRVRTCSKGGKPVGPATFTFKGPRAPGVLKSREELETAVEDAATLQAILEALGFRVVLRYNKLRESWRLGPCQVELDELPTLGKFVEVEGPTADDVHHALARLNLTDRPLLTRSYIQLLLDLGVQDTGPVVQG